MTKEEQLLKMIEKGVDLLKTMYKQVSIVRKANALGFAFDASTLVNIIKKRNKGLPLLKKVAKGIETVVFKELGMTYQPQSERYEKTAGADWVAEIVPETIAKEAPTALPFIFHEQGRPDVQQKAAFIKTARKQIIEFGIRLRTFSEYFISSNESVYKDHLKECLQRGVHIDCYVLYPDSPEARIYFDDRAKVNASEKQALDGAKTAIANLKELALEFGTTEHRGRLKLFHYRHIPYNHILAVDPDTLHGKMQIAHYLYGIKRSDCPVLEIERAKSPKLFEKYWRSLQLLIRDANEIKPG